jgi:hypothetical protein
VQEFQISTVNFDASTNLTSNGAINVVTRSGGHTDRGDGFFFYRDHHLAAYPGLNREPLNPNPFFERRQFGSSFGGPIRRDRAFSSRVTSGTTSRVWCLFNRVSFPHPSIGRSVDTCAEGGSGLPRADEEMCVLSDSAIR